MQLAMNLWILLCSLAGSIYGIYHFFRKGKALYLQMITASVICLLFARLFQVVHIVAERDLSTNFYIGLLGTAGSFMFLFSANYGQMDRLVDDKSARFRKTRIISTISSIAITLLYVLFYITAEGKNVKYSVGITTIFMATSVYYNFKHIIIYDVELGIVKQIKKYNIVAVVYTFLTMFSLIGEYCNVPILYMISCIGIGVCAATIIPVLKGGVDKWTI